MIKLSTIFWLMSENMLAAIVAFYFLVSHINIPMYRQAVIYIAETQWKANQKKKSTKFSPQQGEMEAEWKRMLYKTSLRYHFCLKIVDIVDKIHYRCPMPQVIRLVMGKVYNATFIMTKWMILNNSFPSILSNWTNSAINVIVSTMQTK